MGLNAARFRVALQVCMERILYTQPICYWEIEPVLTAASGSNKADTPKNQSL
jgi:hypothetical protein